MLPHVVRDPQAPEIKVWDRAKIFLQHLATPSSCACRLGNQLCFAVFGQQKDTVDPQIIEQFAQLDKKYAAAANNNDATALAAIYTEDAVRVTDTGKIYGREAIEKYWAALLNQVHFSTHIAKQDTPLHYRNGWLALNGHTGN